MSARASVVALAMLAGAPALAYPVGERHLAASEPSAALRDAKHGDRLRVTIWYPAAADAVETPLEIGPPGRPLFLSGRSALGAAFADDKPRPTILFSHGFGGSARMMAWFGTALAREGYVVIAVDHPGNNGADPMTVAGAVMSWERPDDLRLALTRVEADPALAAHVDPTRLGAAGFSAGGFTALAAAGARVSIRRLWEFCAAHPNDGVCAPQKEFTVTRDDAEKLLAEPEIAAQIPPPHADLAIPGVKAAFVMAPAIVQAFDPDDLKQMRTPVAIVLGDADNVAPPATNGEIVAATVPGATINVLPSVGHYDFLADCTPAGDAVVPVCPTKAPRGPTHSTATGAALDLFRRVIGPP